jgi:hypothetical protein
MLSHFNLEQNAMFVYRLNDIRESDIRFNTLSLGNIPIKIENGRLELVDPNPNAPRLDPDFCDTPNFSLRVCDNEHAELLRSRNNKTRLQADAFLELKLGRRDSAPFISREDLFARTIAAFFGMFNQSEISAGALPPRIRDRNANPFLPTSGDPDFRRASGKYRRVRRLDSDRRLGDDASWFTVHHFAPSNRSTAR